MTDKILILRKELINIVKSNGFTRMKKYELIREQCSELEEDELYVLKKEFESQYEKNRHSEEFSVIPMGISGATLILTIAGLYFNSAGESMSAEIYDELLIWAGVFIIICICCYVFGIISRKIKSAYIRFVLDILDKVG